MEKTRNRIFDDIYEKIELYDRKINILENLLNDLRSNIENKKPIEIVLNTKLTKKKLKNDNINLSDNNINNKINNSIKKKTKKKKLYFNYRVIDTSDSESD
jgi:hypothetical protein|uniref:Uncharacterized protein n=1 Tax=Mimiviridae sp. ChoanoV1 TaxID=2596887 RepID=A0A5B8IHE3_9VIRU|nr:hypothetical protein 1_300 [Mimiviridae sp. ChoanoV1]